VVEIILENDSWFEPVEEPEEKPEDHLQEKLDIGTDRIANCSDINKPRLTTNNGREK
ncbi:5891_t:CDS:1, partial [Cetraspora pellucida]